MKKLVTLMLICISFCLALPLGFAQDVTFSDQIDITTDANIARCVYSADLDGDGDIDVLSASLGDDKVAWYENTDGLGTFGPQQIISTDVSWATAVTSADLDGDGDYDVISGSYWEGEIHWYENTDGLGNFGEQQVITSGASGATFVFSADLDGDGDNDVLSASAWDSEIAWYANSDGLGDFGVQQIITTNAGWANSVFSADLDGDGDMDVLSASESDNKIAWYDNTNGLGSFGGQQIISTDAQSAYSVFSIDLDGDGDNDVISGSYADDKVAWYENTDGLGDFGEEQIITTDADGAMSVCGVDMDLDGDYDVLSASYNDGGIAWFENTDGLGSFGDMQLIDIGGLWVRSVRGADLDGDGDYDVLTASEPDDKIAWYRNQLEVAGLELTITPWDDPTFVGPDGGNFRWDAVVENTSDEAVNFDAWTGLILPDGTPYEPLDIFYDLTLLSGQVLMASPNQLVPGFAPNGIYTYIARVGDFDADEILAEDSFEFAKLPLAGPAATVFVNNEWKLSGWFDGQVEMTGLDEDLRAIPLVYSLEQPYPNPFNPQTNISVSLPLTSNLDVLVFNSVGQLVDIVAKGSFEAGYYSFTFDGANLSSGIYFIHANVPGKMNEIRKVVLMK